MKIAVTYDNGNIYKHFSRTEQFKIYETDSGTILSEELIDTEEIGHGALIDFLENIEADVLICGNVGAAVQEIFDERGIQLYCGIEGKAEEAVCRFLNGELI